MKQSEPMTTAEKQKAYRERLQEKQEAQAKDATAARNLFYWLERCGEQGVYNVTLDLNDIDPFLEVNQVVQLVAAQVAVACIHKMKEKGERKDAATNGTHAPVPPSPVQEIVSPNGSNPATVKATRKRKA